MSKARVVLIVIGIVSIVIGIYFFKPDKKKIVLDRYDPNMYSHTFKWVDNIPAIKTNDGLTVLLLDERPYKKADREPLIGQRMAY